MGIRYYDAFCLVTDSSAILVSAPAKTAPSSRSRLTFTGIIGTICWFPLNAIIAACVALRIHPNVLTLVGVIINIGSVNSVLVQHGSVPYPVSKGAVNLLTKVMAISLADNGIRVCAIGPGPTKTAMEAAVMADPAKRKIRESRTALRRW